MSAFPIDAPRQLLMPEPWQQGVLVLVSLALAAFSLLALWQLLRQRDPMPLFAMLGGALTVMLEPITNVLGQAYHPEIGQVWGYTLLGRGIPLHIALVYPVYFGAYSWLLIRSFERGISSRGFWKLFAGSAIFAFLIEVVPVHVGLWIYYGAQPFNLAGMPLWWYVANPTAIIGTATIAYLGVRSLQGWARWPLIVLIPFGGVAVHTGVSAPIYMGLNSTNNASDNILPGLITIVFCWVMLLTFRRLLLTDASERGGKA